MDQLLQQIVVGLEAGSSYSLIGIAIVVIMKATDVPNFATAEMGLVAAYMAWFLSAEPDKGGVGWPFWLAIVIALVFSAVFGAVSQYFLVRPLTGERIGRLGPPRKSRVGFVWYVPGFVPRFWRSGGVGLLVARASAVLDPVAAGPADTLPGLDLAGDHLHQPARLLES